MSTSPLEKSFSALLELCSNIDEAKQQRTLPGLGSKKINPVIVSLNKYKKVFERTEAAEHKDYLFTIYNKFRKEILKNDGEAKWLRNNSVHIQYGENLTNSSDFEKVKTIRVYLSIFYNDAIKLRDEIEKELEGLPTDVRASRNELLYPDYFMLHWYRLCKCVATIEEDKKTLKKIVRSIESDLGVEHDEIPDQSAKAADPLGGIMMNLAKSFGGSMGGMGSQLPALPAQSNQNVNTEDIGKIVSNVLQNPNITKTINNMVADFNQCTSLEQVVGKLVSKLNDPTLTEAIGSAMAQTGESAVSSSVNGGIIKEGSPRSSPKNTTTINSESSEQGRSSPKYSGSD